MPAAQDRPSLSETDVIMFIAFVIIVIFLCRGVFFLTSSSPGNSAAGVGTSCRGGLINYTCTKDFGCEFSYVGHKKLHSSVIAKAHLCLRECHRACSQDEGYPVCFNSCCNCLDEIYYALAPMVQPPL